MADAKKTTTMVVLEKGADVQAGTAYVGSLVVGKEGTALPPALRAEGTLIRVLVDNPKRVGSKSFDRFACYGSKGTERTRADTLKAGLKAIDLAWDFARGHIAVSLPKG